MTNISKEVKIFSHITALSRFWFWFVEALIPIFLYDFSKSFSETWFLLSLNQISIFLLTPIIWILSNKISIKRIILIWIFFYFLTWLSYFLSWVFALSIFIIFARLINWIASSFISIWRQSCVYKYSANKFVSENLWYFESVTNFARVLPMFIWLFLVWIFPIHYLFLLIMFFALLALIIWNKKLVSDKKEELKINNIIKLKKLKNIYVDYFTNFKNCNKKILKIMLIWFFINLIDSAILFAIPVEAYQSWAGLKMVILMAIVSSIPEISWVYLWKISDKYPIKSYLTWIILFILLLWIIIFVKSYLLKVFFILIFSILVKILDYVKNKFNHYYFQWNDLWTITWVNTQFSFLWSLAWPLIIWIIIDLFWFNYAIFFLIFILLVCLFMWIKYFKEDEKVLQIIQEV
jgi:hypothetical protein